jgi:hypothetical protein
MQYIIYGKAKNKEDDINIHCHDLDDMLTYRDEMIKQGYSCKVEEDER